MHLKTRYSIHNKSLAKGTVETDNFILLESRIGSNGQVESVEKTLTFILVSFHCIFWQLPDSRSASWRAIWLRWDRWTVPVIDNTFNCLVAIWLLIQCLLTVNSRLSYLGEKIKNMKWRTITWKTEQLIGLETIKWKCLTSQYLPRDKIRIISSISLYVSFCLYSYIIEITSVIY